ncbi:MAG TPA: formylglycine-generating enzyme family protein, partial [Candidatus Sumerlaeota bacterium]|nr:formylglycine-generating enzyme family protein [Candidatus Sumerlaeota bacterium]
MRNYRTFISGFSAAAVFILMLTNLFAAEVSIENIEIKTRWPWSHLVDVHYTITADPPDTEVFVSVYGVDGDYNQIIPMRTLSGEGASGSVQPGSHVLTWDPTADWPDFHSSRFSVRMEAFTAEARYLILDLSGGPEASSYPFSYLTALPDPIPDEYRTTLLALRYIPAGAFAMGSPETELGRGGDETLHNVALTRPFYIGVFEVTQKQWELVMGANPSGYKGDMRPVEQVSYDDIRGSSEGAGWPAHNRVDPASFIGKMRIRTGLELDLPTEAQWEYACRAGTVTALNSGKDLTATGSCPNMAEVGRYNFNRSDGRGGYSEHTNVGMYRVNNSGLYDMHGNVYEWCVDWYGSYGGDVSNPLGPSSGGPRVARGGFWEGRAQYCR